MSLLAILDCFDHGGSPSLTAAQIVARSGLPRSSVFRDLRTLIEAGYVHKAPEGRRYTLGRRVLQLGIAARRQLVAADVVTVPLTDLATRTGETVTFSILELPNRICVHVIEAPSDLRQVTQVGATYQLHLGAAGKVILAWLPLELSAAVLKGYGMSMADRDAVLRQLPKIRANGFAISSGERVPGASSVAAPIFVGETVEGSVAAVGPTSRMKPTLDAHRRSVLDAARTISQALTRYEARRGKARSQGEHATTTT